MIKPFKTAIYFDKGQTPTVCCINKSLHKYDSYGGFPKLIEALQKYVSEYIAPVWGVTCQLKITEQIDSGCWAMVFMDDPDISDALGYHDLTQDHLPISKIFVKTTINSGDEVSVTAAHEIAEMLVDPGIQLCAIGPKGFYAWETNDACQADTFTMPGYGKIPMSDFVYPAWFEAFRKPKSTQFNHLNTITRPFQLLKGGYISIYYNNRWHQAFGSNSAEKKFRIAEHPRAKIRLLKALNAPLEKLSEKGS